MLHRRLLIAPLVVALAIPTALWWRHGDTPAPMAQPADLRQGKPENAALASTTPMSDTDEIALVPPDALVRHETRQAFIEDLRHFLEQPERVPAAQRREFALSRMDAVRDYAERGEFSAAEAMMVQLELLRHVVPEAEYEEAAQAMIDSAAEQSTAREEAWRFEQERRLQPSRERERAVLDEVESMESVPDGMTRGQDLRQRLQEEREQLAREQRGTGD